MSGKQLFALRRRMGMLFQNGALLTDLDVYENVAFPLRAHTDLPESLVRQLVLTKLHAVGLRGAARLMPAELSGGMARRVALARAIVMDPDILIYDEPFVGLDPISMGVICRLIKQMNEALGITSIVVSHDVHELSTHRARQFPAVGGQGGGLGHARGAARAASSQKCASSWAGSPTVRCRSTIRRPTTAHELLDGERHRERRASIRCRGRALRRIGAMTLFLVQVLARIGPALAQARAHRAADLQRRRALAGHHHVVRACSSAWCSACWVSTRLPAIRLRGLRSACSRRSAMLKVLGSGADGAVVCRARRYLADVGDRSHEDPPISSPPCR